MPVTFTFSVEELPLVEIISDDLLLITLSAFVVVDTAYTNTNNYAISVVSGSGDIRIRRVLTPLNTKVTTDILLVVDKHTEGTQYRVSVTGLSGRDGSAVGGTSDFLGRRTKTAEMLRTLSNHFDTSPDSVIRNIITAIGISDDIIGGSRNDTFT